MPKPQATINWDEARGLLGIDAAATPEAMRLAYLEQVRLHPPDRDPDLFERIRDAYDHLRDPRVRAASVMQCPDPAGPLAQIMEGVKPPRRFVGPQPWLAALKESRS